ncbi:16S rRNA (cytosine967-C5)-methyltransferase [Novimethylophilus kurashikiensis]|uniref:16S rRNA (Cytosine967-C5)-methyltransferase n=1 Tax=Novimethylophilus kurashikiensis TaxID=1825523 RepID=A0A2R5FAC3_9PROT|nr:RsmB/NOP family class I SAM-dependent RNA methyltransferase [Novimethylophilus kurashikiensis]GBG13641.1 16S rRNA (cytosine967-C5)-methyltransferase [Novimethylophilus kurashikiensis]
MAISPALFDTTVEAITELQEGSGPADARLSAYFRNHRKLGSHDRAFIAETAYALLRRRRFLDYLAPEASPRRLVLACLVRVNGLSPRELEPFLRKTEVEWLREIKAKPADNLPLAVQAELPDWLWERLVAQYGEEEALAIARSLQQTAPLDLRVNRLKGQREAVLALFTKEGLTATPTPYSPDGVRLKEKIALNQHVLFNKGVVEVQDEGSQLLAALVAPRRGEMVADFCAGAGGKTLALGAIMANTGRLYAFDVSERRLSNLRPRLARSGLSNLHPQLIANERDQKLKRLAQKFDRVLVDAPCSGLGTLRRNPDLKWRQSEMDIAELTVKQGNILEAAAKLVKPGGRLVYATCSLLEAENEGVVAAFLAQHPEFEQANAAEILAQQKIELDTGDFLKLLPHKHGTDGFFAAVLTRR